MKPISYLDRTTGQYCEEKVYGGFFINLLYGKNPLSRYVGSSLAHIIARLPHISSWYGHRQRKSISAKKILPFIKKYEIDISEFAEDPSSFRSFNDFFTRKLKPEARPIAPDHSTAIIPADGRYLFYPNIAHVDGFVVKGKKFCLKKLLGSADLAEQYAEGAMVIARLCPSDYHRYHFPCDGIPGKTHLINGHLYSVNPMAIKKNIHIFTENKRTLCTMKTALFGEVLILEVGATCVGTIHQTYHPGQHCAKGDEKGFFSFGGSTLILLFPPNSIKFDQDLVNATDSGVEIRCLMGQSMGKSTLA